jgi:predicted regulator of Ras-like GTPase activity (Roadblock/LC7/MglB family)
VRVDLSPLKDLAGFCGAAVVDCETGLLLGRLAARAAELDTGAAGATDVIRAARGLAAALAADGDVEDVIVSFRGQYHMARIVESSPAIVIYLALDRPAANLGLAHLTLRQVERAVGP